MDVVPSSDGANNLANAPSSNGNGDSPAISEAKESGSMQSFLQTLRRTFGSRFLCYLVLNYMFLKGMVFTMLQTSMLPYFQKMGVKGVEFQLASVVAMIPWSMKGFIGVLSDIVPIGRFHKRGYLLLSAMLGGFGVCVLGLWRPGEGHLWTAAALFGCAFTFLATFDLLCEGKYSEMMREEKAGSEVLTFVWTMCQWGSLLAAAVLYFVIDSEGPRPVILGCLPFAFVAFWRTWMGDLHEEPARSWKSLRAKAYSEPELFLLALLMACGSLVVALATAFWGRQGRLLAAVSVSVLLVVFSFRTLPRVLARSNLYMFIISISYLDLSGPLSYWYTGTDGCVPSGPHFSYSYFLAVSNVVGSAGSMLGAVLFQSMQSWSFRSAFRVTTFVQISASLFDLFIITRMNLTLGIPDAFAYLFGDAACQSIAAQMIIMPQALLTARLCPRGAEATVFAILAGFQNFGSNIGSILGAQLAETYGIQCSRLGPCNFESLINLIILCHILAPMACLSFLFLVPTAKMNDEKAFATDSPPPSFASPSPSPLNSPRVSDPDSPEPEGDGEYFLLQDDGMVVRQLSG